MKMRSEEEEEKFHQASFALISFDVVSTHWQRHGYENSCGVEGREKKLWHDVGNYENKAAVMWREEREEI